MFTKTKDDSVDFKSANALLAQIMSWVSGGAGTNATSKDRLKRPDQPAFIQGDQPYFATCTQA
jgi:hypothetical protein